MSSKPTAAELLAAVKASPAAVATHDRAAWVGLFAADGQVNDPVGSRPHTGRTAIKKFYDTFIAPNTIRFHVEHDVVCGMSVFRDLTIETVMPGGVTLRVPMHLRYDLIEEAGSLKIHRLYAHWELLPMIFQLLGTGLGGLWTAIKLGPQLIAHQGLDGVFGFMRGFSGVGGAGKRAVDAFLAAVSRGDTGAAEVQMAPGAVLELPAGERLLLTGFVARARKLEWRKLIAAGRTVTATVVLGPSMTAPRGVALFLFEAVRPQISGVQIFIEKTS